MSTINLGPVGFNPTGEYNSTYEYEKLDVVYYEGSSYVAKSNSIGQLPTNTEYWDCIAVGYIKQNIYNSVAEMKADDTLKNGMFAQTVGYYEANDNGGGFYLIKSTFSSSDYKEVLDNGLYAILLNENSETNVSQLGIAPGLLTTTQIDNLNAYIESHPYCSLKFGEGTYQIPKPILLLQGSSLKGVGNDTRLMPLSNQWAIVCKGLSSLNSTTEVCNFTIDGNFVGNGIYIDGTRYSRCEIHDLFITSCLYGIRGAQPQTPGVYDDNYTTGNGGNNLHDLFIYGEIPNGDTSRCREGLVLFSNDNFLSDIRVSGFNTYGTRISGVGTQFSNFKACVNHISIKLSGQHHVGELCADESFQNNIELEYLRNSNLLIKTAAGGCVVADSLPTQLNYYDVLMTNCSNNTLEITGLVAQTFTYRKSGEKAVLKLQDSLLNDIKINFGNANTPNSYCVPIESNCAFINTVKINTNDYTDFISYNILDNITPVQAGGTTLSGTYPNLHVLYTGSNQTQNLFSLDLTSYIDDNLIVADNAFGTYPPQLYQIGYKFNEESTGRSYVNQPTQFHSSYGQNGAVIFSLKIKDILETLDDYNDGITAGYTLQYVRLFFRCTHTKAGESDHVVYVIKES